MTSMEHPKTSVERGLETENKEQKQDKIFEEKISLVENPASQLDQSYNEKSREEILEEQDKIEQKIRELEEDRDFLIKIFNLFWIR